MYSFACLNNSTVWLVGSLVWDIKGGGGVRAAGSGVADSDNLS
jgi:hypothetical protein